MRHRVKGSKLGRTASHKKATMRSLSIALLTHHRVVTTLAKAKELRRYVEPIINRAKEDTMHNRREVFSFIHDNKTVTKLFDEIGLKVADREGGYTRVVKIGYRTGDSADMAVIELVDYNTTETADTGKKKRTRRAGKAAPKAEVATAKGSKAEDADVVAEADVVETEVTDTVTEEVVDEVVVEETTAEVVESTDDAVAEAEATEEASEESSDNTEEEKK
jgi:large subunit ribosomal protein L17